MNYKVLYRKYRPSNFDEVVGQNNTISLLKDSVINEKISHAYIFSGPRGTGKTSSAKIFAKAINCLEPIKGNPCGKCANCLGFTDSNDIYEIDAASNNGVDQIREIVDNIKLTPINMKYKVYIIDEVHMLSTSAFNALLLTLEEPPKHAVFILATTDIEDVPITVLSRCQRLDFHKISERDISENLKKISEKESIDIELPAIEEISNYCEGGMRDALSILDQLSKSQSKITQELVLESIGIISDKKINELIDYYDNNDINNIIDFVDFLRINAIDFKSLIKRLVKQLRNRAVKVLGSGDINKYSTYKDLCFELSSLLYRTNVNVDVYTLLEFKLIPTVGKNKNEANSEQNRQNFTENHQNFVQNHQNFSNNEQKVDLPTQNDKMDAQNVGDGLIDIRINNCFVDANKSNLSESKILWKSFIDSIESKKIKGLLLDTEIVLASPKISVIKVEFSNYVNEINNNITQIEELFNKKNNTEIKLIAVSQDVWLKKMEEYKNNIKNNKKYIIIKEPEVSLSNNLMNDVFSSIEVK